MTKPMNAVRERASEPRSRERLHPGNGRAARRVCPGAGRSRARARHQLLLDPGETTGNIEHFLGAAQVPIGLAGPLLINGEYAEGELYVPMATAEGTLVASYNRGMRLLHEAGGVTATTTTRSRSHH